MIEHTKQKRGGIDLEHTTEIQQEDKIEPAQSASERTESRSAYQKRKRETEKQEKRRGRKRIFLFAVVFVIAAGILCGAVIASSIGTPQDTVKIASANAAYVKTTLQTAVQNKLSDISEFLHNLSLPDFSNVTIGSGIGFAPGKDNDTPIDSDSADAQTTTESAVAIVPEDNPYGIDPSKPMIALTFDDGPSKYTWSIVSSLVQHDARATFFLVGNRVATHEAAIDFLLENHQEVASHSFSHANLAQSTDEEVLAQIQKADSALQTQHDYTPTLFRVPYGERDQRVMEILRQQGKPAIGWSVDPRDWEVQDKDTIVKHVLSHVKDGDIVLMHDLYKPTADAVAELIPALQEKGYQLVTVSELLQYKGIALTPGTYYYASWKWV